MNHLVVISNLTPSKVYHLRALAKDSSGNLAESVDMVTITLRGTDDALELVMTSLLESLRFLRSAGRDLKTLCQIHEKF